MIFWKSLEEEEEFFAINPDIRYEAVQLNNGTTAIIIDDFYKNPEGVREFILNTQGTHFRSVKGNLVGERLDMKCAVYRYHSVVREMGQYISTYDFKTPVAKLKANKTWSHDRPHKPHIDGKSHTYPQCVASVLYLNTEEECDGGTAFFTYQGDPTLTVKNSSDWSNEDYESFSKNEKGDWKQVDTLEMKFNRLVVYRGDKFHSSIITPTNFLKYPRIVQVSFMKEEVVDNSRDARHAGRNLIRFSPPTVQGT